MDVTALLPLAAGEPDYQNVPMMWAASGVLGLAIAILVLTWLIVANHEPDDEHLRGDERLRRRRMRTQVPAYARTEALIEEFLPLVSADPIVLSQVRKDLVFSEAHPWKPEEFLSFALVKGLIVGSITIAVLFLIADPVMAVLAGLAVGFVTRMLELGRVRDRAASRRMLFKRRLPFAVDLLASMLQAGAVFGDALRTVTRESTGHPLGEEFGKVLQETEMGRPRREALESLDKRVGDPDLTEMVFAVNKGEELGTKLSDIFKDMADQMRLKRSQWAEKLAAQAQVMMVFPGMLTMLACLLVVTAPFVLKALYALN